MTTRKMDLRLALKRKLPALKRLFANNPLVMGVWLFGSQADGTATRESAIDFGVLFKRRPIAQDKRELENSLRQAIGREEIKVVDLRRSNLGEQHRAISGKLLYEKDYVRVSDFIEHVLKMYPDYEWYRRRFEEDYKEGLRLQELEECNIE